MTDIAETKEEKTKSQQLYDLLDAISPDANDVSMAPLLKLLEQDADVRSLFGTPFHKWGEGKGLREDNRYAKCTPSIMLLSKKKPKVLKKIIEIMQQQNSPIKELDLGLQNPSVLMGGKQEHFLLSYLISKMIEEERTDQPFHLKNAEQLLDILLKMSEVKGNLFENAFIRKLFLKTYSEEDISEIAIRILTIVIDFYAEKTPKNQEGYHLPETTKEKALWTEALANFSSVSLINNKEAQDQVLVILKKLAGVNIDFTSPEFGVVFKMASNLFKEGYSEDKAILLENLITTSEKGFENLFMCLVDPGLPKTDKDNLNENSDLLIFLLKKDPHISQRMGKMTQEGVKNINAYYKQLLERYVNNPKMQLDLLTEYQKFASYLDSNITDAYFLDLTSKCVSNSKEADKYNPILRELGKTTSASATQAANLLRKLNGATYVSQEEVSEAWGFVKRSEGNAKNLAEYILNPKSGKPGNLQNAKQFILAMKDSFPDYKISEETFISLLREAIKSNDGDFLNILLSRKDVKLSEEKVFLLLMDALQSSNLNLFKQILSKNDTIFSQNNAILLLREAIKNTDPEFFNLLFSVKEIKLSENNLILLLRDVIVRNDVKLFARLLPVVPRGALLELDAPFKHEEEMVTPVQLLIMRAQAKEAATSSSAKNLLQKLLNEDVRINIDHTRQIRDSQGTKKLTTLELAALYNMRPLVELALKQNKDVVIDVQGHDNQLINAAFKNGWFSLVERFHNEGAELSKERALAAAEELKKQKNTDMQAKVLKWANINTTSLFVNERAFYEASVYVHKKVLSKPYNNGLSQSRWRNQRCLILLETGDVQEVASSYLYGIDIAIRLQQQRMSESSKSKEPAKLREVIITVPEIVREYNEGRPKEQHIRDEDVGKINIKAAEQKYGRIKAVMYRQNHDTDHSIRAAAFIKEIHELISIPNSTELDTHVKLSNNKLEILQLMMLFSVLGREDETGFHDEEENAQDLYKTYRIVSALEFLKYCRDHWDYYKNIFWTEDALYQAAYVVELMGYPKFPKFSEIEGTHPILPILMRSGQQWAKRNTSLIVSEFSNLPNNNHLLSLKEADIESLFPTKQINLEGGDSAIFLNYMNQAHAIELLRCYGPGKYDSKKNQAKMINVVQATMALRYDAQANKGELKGTSGNLEIAAYVLEYLKFAQNLLETFGNKMSSRFDLDTIKFNELKRDASQLELFILNNLDVSFTDMESKLVPIQFVGGDGNKYQPTWNEFITNLNLQEILQSTGKQVKDNEGKIIDVLPIVTPDTIVEIVSRFIGSRIFTQPSNEYKKSKFDTRINYTRAEIGRETQDIDQSDPNYENYSKEVEAKIKKVNAVPRPSFCRDTGYPQSLADYFKHLEQRTEAYCGNGLEKPVRKNGNVYLLYPSTADAQGFFKLLMEEGKFEKMPTITSSVDPPIGAIVELTELQYAQIRRFLKFRLVAPPKSHSVEDKLVSAEGVFIGVDLIQSTTAVVTNHNSRPFFGQQLTGVNWFAQKMETPSTDRGFRIVKGVKDQEEYNSDTRIIKLDLTKTKPEPVPVKIIDVIPLHKQEPIDKPRERSEFFDEKGNRKTSEVFAKRGSEKNTIFTKKMPMTVLPPSGMVRLFQGRKNDKPRYFPLGFMFDFNLLEPYGGLYFWGENVTSNQMFWINNDDVEDRKLSLSFEEIRKRLGSDDISKKWTEFLLGASKTALTALICPGIEEMGEEKDVSPLTYKMNLISQAIFLKKQFGIQVPLMVIDGSHIPKRYNERMLEKDVIETITRILDDTYPYICNKVKERLLCDEQAILMNLVATLTGDPSPPVLEMIETFEEYIEKYPNDSEEKYREKLGKINTENTKKLKRYVENKKLDQNNVHALIEGHEFLASASQERRYIEKKLQVSPILDVEVIQNLLMRNAALGHVSNMEYIFNQLKQRSCSWNIDNPLNHNWDTLLHVAVKNLQFDIISYLLDKGADPNLKNFENLTPIEIINKRMSTTRDNELISQCEKINEELKKPRTIAATQPSTPLTFHTPSKPEPLKPPKAAQPPVTVTDENRENPKTNLRNSGKFEKK